MTMRKIDEICAKVGQDLQKYGVDTFIVLAKCPDSRDIGMNKQGDRVYLVGGLETAKIIVQGELFQKNRKT